MLKSKVILIDYNTLLSRDIDPNTLYIVEDDCIGSGYISGKLKKIENKAIIRTGYHISSTIKHRFEDSVDNMKIIAADIENIIKQESRYKHICFPIDGLGKNASKLSIAAPGVYRSLNNLLLTIFGIDYSKPIMNKSSKMEKLFRTI